MRNVILYGSDAYAAEHDSELKRLETDQIKIVQSILQSPEAVFLLSGLAYDYVFIMDDKLEKDYIRRWMKQTKDSYDRIIPFEVFHLPEMDLDLYETIRQRKITVFSNFCFGGLLARTFRIENRTPLKNMWLTEGDYLKLLENPEHYLKLKPHFYRFSKRQGPADRRIYPILKLGDIRLFCNHVISPLKAIRDWNRRVKKVNMDDLIVIFITDNPSMEERFYRLHYPYMRCITDYPSRYKNTIQLTKEGNEHPLHAANRLAMNQDPYYSVTGLILKREEIRTKDS